MSRMSELERYNFFGIEKEVADTFVKSLELHITYVQEACRKLKVPEEQTIIHDNSKWSAAEFPGYAEHFSGGGAPDLFSEAWLHHVHHNPHHWQHWIFPDRYTPKGSKVIDGCIKMPERYALEMVADWMGASKAYTGSWDMTEWLEKNIPRIDLHPKTGWFVGSVLTEKLDYNILDLNFKAK